MIAMIAKVRIIGRSIYEMITQVNSLNVVYLLMLKNKFTTFQNMLLREGVLATVGGAYPSPG